MLNRKITKNKSDHVLVKNELNTLKNKIPDVSSLAKKTDLNTKVAAIDTKISTLDGKITENKNKLEKAALGIILFSLGKTMFDGEDGSQAHLVFQPVYRYFKFITNTNYISSWKSKRLSGESINPPTTSDNSLTPLIGYYDYNITVKFNGSFRSFGSFLMEVFILRQPKVTYTHKKVVNIYISY